MLIEIFFLFLSLWFSFRLRGQLNAKTGGGRLGGVGGEGGGEGGARGRTV